jgi:hypothetical protein
MKKWQITVLGMAVMVLVLGFVFTGCDNGNGTNDPTPPAAAYLNEKKWITTVGYMPDDITSITIEFSGDNQWTETFNGSGSKDGKTILGTYTLSGLKMSMTIITGGTMTDLPPVGTTFQAEFDATQATKFTTSQGHIFNRQP